MAPLAYTGKPQSRKSIISLSEWEASNAVLNVWNKPPNRTVGAVYAAEQRTNALWTATRYELSFRHGNLIVWYWFSAGCAGGDRFSSRSFRPAAGKMAHARDRRLCSWPHSRADHSQPSSRFHVQTSSAPSPGRRRRHAFSESEVRRMSCGVKGATPAAAARAPPARHHVLLPFLMARRHADPYSPCRLERQLLRSVARNRPCRAPPPLNVEGRLPAARQ